MTGEIVVGSLVKFCEIESQERGLIPPMGYNFPLNGSFDLKDFETVSGSDIGVVVGSDIFLQNRFYHVLVGEKKLWFFAESVFPISWSDT